MSTAVAPSRVRQVVDDVDLLDLIIADHATAPSRFQPTNYWRQRSIDVANEVRRGLHDFQARGVDDLLSTFGATDPPPTLLTSFYEGPSDGERNVAHFVSAMNSVLRDGYPVLPFHVSTVDLLQTGYLLCEHVAARSEQIAPISKLSVSRVGNPYGTDVQGRFITASALSYYMRYAFVAEQLDFANVDTVVELGSGAGKQAEILKCLHPHLAIVLLDLPSQLYVADRYLSAVFPNDVVPYGNTRRPGTIEPEPGKIHVCSNARIVDLADTGRTLFWNAASFGEMEPDVVAQYGSDITTFADWLFLHQCFDGKERKLPGGVGGVLQQVRYPHYLAAFEQYRMTERRRAHTGLAYLVEGDCKYEDTFWQRRDASSSAGMA